MCPGALAPWVLAKLRPALVLLFNLKTRLCLWNNKGSSETTRGAFLACAPANSGSQPAAKKNKNYFKFDNFVNVSPKHKNAQNLNYPFLEWFIGFSEGDGCFGAHENGRPYFVINQTDLRLVKKIHTELGFGTVNTFTQEGKTYARFSVYDKKGLLRLIHLFNGNLHLSKTHSRFSPWVEHYNHVFGLTIPVKPRLYPSLISLQTGWLAGFFDAEGCCYAHVRQYPRHKNGARLDVKATVDQKGELDVLTQIAQLLMVPEVTPRSREKGHYRVEVTSKTALAKIVRYLDVYKLQGRKSQTYAVWRKLVNLFVNGLHLDQTYASLKERADRVGELNQLFKNEKCVFTIESLGAPHPA